MVALTVSVLWFVETPVTPGHILAHPVGIPAGSAMIGSVRYTHLSLLKHLANQVPKERDGKSTHAPSAVSSGHPSRQSSVLPWQLESHGRSSSLTLPRVVGS